MKFEIKNVGDKPISLYRVEPEVISAIAKDMAKRIDRSLAPSVGLLPEGCICFEEVLGEVFFVKRKDCPVHGDGGRS